MEQRDAERRPDEPQGGQGFLEAALGRPFLERVGRYAARIPDRWQVAAFAAALGGLLLIPYLGAVGLWDPWEVHYSEVGRMMLHRRDFLYPFWESTWFLSKPPLTMWIQALAMAIVGTNRTQGALALYTEWGIRLPFALLSIGSLALLATAVSRVASRRAALASVVALLTMPMFFLISRQAVTDVPMVALITCAMSCAIIALLDPKTKHRTGWWFGFHVSVALTLLAKEMLAAIPPAALLLYAAFCVLPWNAEAWRDHARWLTEPSFRKEVKEGSRPMPTLWDYMFRMRLLSGIGVFLAIAAPWYAMMFAFDGIDDENLNFVQRIIHDNFQRLGAGVHTTTPGGDFTYFIQQGGYAIFPWVALLPGVVALLARIRLRSKDRTDQLASLTFFWMLLSFALFAFSATKFHHYVFPVLPPLAVLMGLYIDKLWEEGVAAHAMSLIIGAVLFALVGRDLADNPKNFTDLFVYNYDRPYPTELVTDPLTLFGYRPLWTGDLLTLLLLAIGGYLAAESFRENQQRNVPGRAMAILLALCGLALLGALSTRGQESPVLFLGLAAAVVAIFLGYEASRGPKAERPGLFAMAGVAGAAAVVLIASGYPLRPGTDPLLPVLTQTVNIKTMMGIAFLVGGVLCALGALQRARTMLFGSFVTLALGFAFWFNWDHWVDLSHQWTQRDQFWRYWDQRKPGEPIAAFLMNWRGETFYSKNTVKQIKENPRMAAYANLPGRKWALVEHYRLNLLKGAIGPNKIVTPVDPELNNKFVLVTIDWAPGAP